MHNRILIIEDDEPLSAMVSEYLTVVLVLIIFGLLTSAVWWLGPGQDDRRWRVFNGLELLLDNAVPDARSPIDDTRRMLAGLSQELDADISLRAPDGDLLVALGEPINLPEAGTAGWIHGVGRGPGLALQLADGRWVLGRARPHSADHLHGTRWLWAVALLAIAVAIGAHPIARRITRRLERLQSNVEALGAGDLAARVDVQGKDEVAELARSFNVAADRIERLVDSQRNMLAGASHELRSPLARIRMAIELLSTEQRPGLRERIEADIAELDGLIDELLVASRLETTGVADREQPVDLLAVAAEECARAGAHLEGSSVEIIADPKLMHRLLGNLLRNAVRHGAGSKIEVYVQALENGRARVTVSDRGPGVPEPERERIFEPFYRPKGVSDSGDGVGLGLALVQRIARHYRGDVRCLPREGGGTQFEVTLG